MRSVESFLAGNEKSGVIFDENYITTTNLVNRINNSASYSRLLNFEHRKLIDIEVKDWAYAKKLGLILSLFSYCFLVLISEATKYDLGLWPLILLPVVVFFGSLVAMEVFGAKRLESEVWFAIMKDLVVENEQAFRCYFVEFITTKSALEKSVIGVDKNNNLISSFTMRVNNGGSHTKIEGIESVEIKGLHTLEGELYETILKLKFYHSCKILSLTSYEQNLQIQKDD